MSFSNVGKIWTPDSFKDYLQTVPKPSFVNAVVLHHTAAPSLAQRPKGFIAQHLINIRDFYKSKGWNRGPHLFVDDDQIFGMTPLDVAGIHAVSFNRTAIGIEVLGDYDSEDPFTGRGFNCWSTAAYATHLLLDWLSLPVNDKTVLFHRDDPQTSKTCPGRLVKKDWVKILIGAAGQGLQSNPNPHELFPVAEWLKQNNPTLQFKLSTGQDEDGRRVIYLETDGKKDELEQAIFTDGTTYAPESELRAYLLG